MKIYRADFPADCMVTGQGVVEFPESVELMPPKGTRVSSWIGAEGRLKAAPARDYMPSSVAAAVCSRRLRSLFDAVCPAPDYVQWLPVTIKSSSGPAEFYVMHFAGAFDVLDREKTVFIGTDYPKKPAFRSEVISSFPFFSRAGFSSFEFFVREDLKCELQKERISGLVFELVP